MSAGDRLAFYAKPCVGPARLADYSLRRSAKDDLLVVYTDTKLLLRARHRLAAVRAARTVAGARAGEVGEPAAALDLGRVRVRS